MIILQYLIPFYIEYVSYSRLTNELISLKHPKAEIREVRIVFALVIKFKIKLFLNFKLKTKNQ